MQGRKVSFFTHTKLNPVTGCWEWLGAKYTDGYGMMKYKGRLQATHRIAAMIWKGFKPESGLWVLHKCDNRICCNPKHLFIGTGGDNLLDCVSKGRHQHAKKTHCAHGHEYTEANTYRPPSAPTQ
jgi:hypothetical protein